jgi:hypothetical protein
MREWIRVALIGALACSVSLVGCGDDTGTGPDAGAAPGETDPEAEAGEVDADAVALAALLTQSLQQAFFASLGADPTIVPGAAGTLTITGDNWVFDGYSPDGEQFLDGQLTVTKAQYPSIPATGELTLTGTQEGTLVVDMLIQVQGAQMAVSGTIRLNDQLWEMEQLLAAAAASG